VRKGEEKQMEERGGLSKWVKKKASERERERAHTHPFLHSQWTDSSSHGWSECVVEF